VVRCPMTFMEQFLIVGPGALRGGGQLQYLRRKAHGRIFPNPRIDAAGAVEVPHALGVNPPESLDALIEWDSRNKSSGGGATSTTFLILGHFACCWRSSI